MRKSILIGPVPGVPPSESIEFIVREIINIDGIPNGLNLYNEYAESFATNKSKGVMLVHIKLQKEGDIDDLFIPLAKRVRDVSRDFRQPIKCEKVDRGFELGDNEGDVPYTPVMGPRRGPPTLSEHEPEPDGEYLARVDLGVGSAESWRGKQNDRRGDAAAKRAR